MNRKLQLSIVLLISQNYCLNFGVRFNPFKFKGLVAIPLREFVLTARVLSRQNYNDAAGMVSNTDLAVGWGEMAEEEHANKLRVTQRGRISKFGGIPDVALKKEDVLKQIANIHLIPSTDSLKEKVAKIVVGDVVIISGKLVSFDEDKLHWKTSTTRDDRGCEIIFIEALEIEKPMK